MIFIARPELLPKVPLVAPYRVLDTTASAASVTVRNNNNVIVSTLVPGNTYLIDVAWVDTDGQYAGVSDGTLIFMDVSLGGEVFVERLPGTNINRYEYTAPDISRSERAVTFTWGKYDDTSLTTFQLAEFTITLEESVVEPEGNPIPAGAVQFTVTPGTPYGSFTDAMFSEIFLDSRNWGGGNSAIQTLSLADNNSVSKDALMIRLVPHAFSSSVKHGSNAVNGAFDITTRQEATFTQWVHPQNLYAMGQDGQAAKWGFGLAGGTAPSGGIGKPDGFSCRLIALGHRDAQGNKTFPDTIAGINPALYVYSHDKVGIYGDELRFVDPAIGEPVQLVRGEWAQITMYCKMNSVAGAADGILRGYLNGVLMLERTNVVWFGSGTPHIDQILFSTFHGGATGRWSPSATNEIAFADMSLG